MQVNSVRNQSFGKLYAERKEINKELKKMEPCLRHVARRAISGLDDFTQYDLYVRKGEIKVVDKKFGDELPILVKKSTNQDGGIPFYSALKYIYGKESLDFLSEALTRGNPKILGNNALPEKLESILKNTAIYGTLKTMQTIVAQGIPIETNK